MSKMDLNHLMETSLGISSLTMPAGFILSVEGAIEGAKEVGRAVVGPKRGKRFPRPETELL
jgi:hypothetical protein